MTIAPRAGALVAFWEASRLALAVVGGEEKQRIRLVGSRGEENRVKESRILLEIEANGSAPGKDLVSRQAAAKRVRSMAILLDRAREEIEIGLVWELLIEEIEADDGPAGRPLSELAQLALGRADGPAQAATVLSLLEDGLHFQRKGELWEARERKAVEALELERARVAERESQTEALHAALRAAVVGDGWKPTGSPLEARTLEALEQLALYDEMAPDGARQTAVEALEAAGQRFDRPHEGAFRLLRRLGRFDDDDVNLQVLRYRLPGRFPDEVLEAAERAARAGFSREGREDLTGLWGVSIDGPRTREIDDVLSVQPRDESGWRLGVHIADPGAFVTPGDPVDREAFDRGLTHYHPDLKIPMLPPAISEEAASLVAGEERPAVSFLVDLDDEGAVTSWRLVRSTIRCRRRLDYVGVDAELDGGVGELAEQLRLLERAARAREEARLREGALILDAPEVDLRVGPDGTPELERLEWGCRSRRIVTEAMVLAGGLGAEFCRDAGLPAVFRRQAAPALPPGPADAERWDPVQVRRIRRSLRRGESALEPARHHALGLDAYAQVTSPLRRYLDLVLQRQILGRLSGDGTLYDLETIQRIAASTGQAEADARRAERSANDYWRLRYLEARVGESVDALVVESDPRPIAILVETLHEQPVPSLSGRQPGDAVRLRIERVNPRAGLVVLRPAD